MKITWLGHASFRIEDGNGNILYIDPWKIKTPPIPADIILVSHSHYDHYSKDDIRKLMKEGTRVIGPRDLISSEGSGSVLVPGETLALGSVEISGIPAYNKEKGFHPRERGWLGFVIAVKGKRIYYAGDTDLIEEMRSLGAIDAALLPVGGTYTMDSEQAARAAEFIEPSVVAIPYHWGDIIGKTEDARTFSRLAGKRGRMLVPNDHIEI